MLNNKKPSKIKCSLKKRPSLKCQIYFRKERNVLKYSLHTKRLSLLRFPIETEKDKCSQPGEQSWLVSSHRHYCRSPGGLPSAPPLSLAPHLSCRFSGDGLKHQTDNMLLSKLDAKERQNSEIDLLGEFYYFAGLILILQHILPFLSS